MKYMKSCHITQKERKKRQLSFIISFSVLYFIIGLSNVLKKMGQDIINLSKDGKKYLL